MLGKAFPSLVGYVIYVDAVRNVHISCIHYSMFHKLFRCSSHADTTFQLFEITVGASKLRRCYVYPFLFPISIYVSFPVSKLHLGPHLCSVNTIVFNLSLIVLFSISFFSFLPLVLSLIIPLQFLPTILVFLQFHFVLCYHTLSLHFFSLFLNIIHFYNYLLSVPFFICLSLSPFFI